jgi:hypothetical protein
MPNKSGVAKSSKVECRMCGKVHEPIEVFWSDNGFYVCSWRCIAIYIHVVMYGTPPPSDSPVPDSIDEAAYWRSYHIEIAKQANS